MEKIERASQSLLSIINDILDFSKIEAGKLDIDSVPFQLDTMLEDLSDMFSEKLPTNRLNYCSPLRQRASLSVRGFAAIRPSVD